jgi:hypothetical protein
MRHVYIKIWAHKLLPILSGDAARMRSVSAYREKQETTVRGSLMILITAVGWELD